MSTPKFAVSHAWVKAEANGWLTFGLTKFAALRLGEIVFLDLPEVGKELRRGDVGVVLESARSICELPVPVSGWVKVANAAAADEPALVSRDPQGAGWLLKLRAQRQDELDLLMDQAAYESLVRRALRSDFQEE